MNKSVKFIYLFLFVSSLTSCFDKQNEELICYVKDLNKEKPFEFKYHISLDFSNPIHYYILSKGVCKAEVEYQLNRWEYQSKGTVYASKDYWTCNTVVFRDKGIQPLETFKINRITGTVYHTTTSSDNRISKYWGYCHKINPKF